MKYKVGDHVRIKSLDWYNENKSKRGFICFVCANFIPEMSRYCGEILTINQVVKEHKQYRVSECEFVWTDEMIEGLVEEEIEKKLSDESWRYKNIFDNLQYPQSFECPEGYIFKDENGNVINATKIVLEKKKKEYPKTYKECCEIVGDALKWDNPFRINRDTHPYIKHLDNLIERFCKLLICREAYWRIAGEEMGLGKPWEPDYDSLKTKYTIVVVENKVVKLHTLSQNHILTFPTEAMRDAFYENFKSEIESVKELL